MAPAMWPAPRTTRSPATTKPIWPACWAGAWPISPSGWRNEVARAGSRAWPYPAAARRPLRLVVPWRPPPDCGAAGVRGTAAASVGWRGAAARAGPVLGGRAGPVLVQPRRDERLGASRDLAVRGDRDRAVAVDRGTGQRAGHARAVCQKAQPVTRREDVEPSTARRCCVPRFPALSCAHRGTAPHAVTAR